MTSFPHLTLGDLMTEARIFAVQEFSHNEPLLYGVTDGKAIGTYFEHKFRRYLQTKFTFDLGSSAKGIDFAEFGVDMKVTSLRQPQSSCPFRSARQKIYGLGYSLLVFVYDKTDDDNTRTGSLRITHTILVDQARTADFQTTTGLRRIVANDGNVDDIIAYFQDRFLPVDEVTAQELAEEILSAPPEIGYLTISNALQWRLQYRRVIEQAGQVDGVYRLL